MYPALLIRRSIVPPVILEIVSAASESWEGEVMSAWMMYTLVLLDARDVRVVEEVGQRTRAKTWAKGWWDSCVVISS